jgi:hypothetical protein
MCTGSILKDLEEHENVQAQFGGSTIYPEKRLIDRDPDWTSQRSTCQQSS